MSVDVETLITDYGWLESSRPILTIAEDRKSVRLQIGSFENAPEIEITASSPEDLHDALQGYVEIFQKAVEITK